MLCKIKIFLFHNCNNKHEKGWPLTLIAAEVKKAWGPNITDETLKVWRCKYQAGLKHANEKNGHLEFGSDKIVCVCDETVVGIHPDDGYAAMAPRGIRKFAPAVRKAPRGRDLVRKRILKRQPARNIWRRPAGEFTNTAV